MRRAARVGVAVLLGVLLTLASSFVGERAATATYPDIMGCEVSCPVVATGWPLVFIRDYTGMSVVGTADMFEVIFAADRFDWQPFAIDVLCWAALCGAGLAARRRRGSLRRRAPE